MKKRAKQLEMKGLKGWGGKRRNAGRKNLSKTVNHMKRESFNEKKPLQITMKFKAGLPDLRSKKMHLEFQRALVKAKAFGLRVIQYTLESNHIHFVVECEGNRALGSAMKSFGSTFGKAVRKLAGGVGSVFVGRYHLSVLKNPTQTRNSLRYVLLNRFKHEKSHPDDNPFSSGKYFANWPELLNRRRSKAWPEAPVLPEYLSPARTWLATRGWMRAALA